MPHPAQLALILLLLPNTSLSDWTQHGGPALRTLMREGAVGLVNVRTAEKDTITTRGSCYSIGAGQRMHATLDTGGLGYDVHPGNLAESLELAGVTETASGRSAKELLWPGDPTSAGGIGALHDNSSFVPDDARTGERLGRRLVVIDAGSDLKQADAVIANAVHESEGDGSAVMVLSTNTPPAAFNSYDRLSPIVWAGRSQLLTSSSTRTPGLVTAADVTATILRFFNAPADAPVNGSPIAVVESRGDPVQYLQSRNQTWIAQERFLALRPYIGLSIAALLVIALVLSRRSASRASAIMAFIAGLPLVMGLSGDVSQATGILAALAFAALIVRRWWTPSVFAGMTTAYLLGDAFLSRGSLAVGSLLGYSPIEGARYYGIGNEVMGALLGASVVTAWLFVRRGWGWAAIAIAAAVAFALGDPQIGAKAGGFIAALFAITGFAWGLSGKPFKLDIAGMLTAITIGAGVVGLVLFSHLGHSHVSGALRDTHRGGLGVIVDIATRKAAMDGHLVFHSVWIWALLIAVFGKWQLRQQFLNGSNRTNRALFAGSVAATAASLALNDAGVVAAALCSLYGFTVCAITAGSIGQESLAKAQPESFPG